MMGPTQNKQLADESVKNEGGGNQATGGKAEAKIEDRTGLYLAILAFGVAMLALGACAVMYVGYADMRTHVNLMDDSYRGWKIYAEAHGFPGPEKDK